MLNLTISKFNKRLNTIIMARNIFKVLLVEGLHALLVRECRAEITQCFGVLGDKYPEFVSKFA